MSKWFTIVLVALMAISLAACGGSGKKCADGTVAVGGSCVPLCTDGETWDGTQCVAAVVCATGTHEDNGECVSDITGCAAGTELVNGQCVPVCADGEYYDAGSDTCMPIPECGTGTHWNADTAQCEPDITECAPGTHMVGTECMPDVVCGPDTHPDGDECVPNTLPPPDVTEDDVVFTVPADGETVSLGGTIDTPVDEDGDGIPDANWDQFQFQGHAGDYLEIMSTSEGAALPAFALMGLDADENVIYQRIGINPAGLVSQREVYLPYDGVYLLLVTDYNHMVAALFGSDTLPVGGPDFTYYVEVTNLGDPVVTDIDSLPAAESGDLDDNTLKFYNVVGLTAGDVYTFTSNGQPLPDVPADLYPDLMLFDSDGMAVKMVAPAPGDSMSFWYTPATSGDHLLVQDFDLAVGPNHDFAFGIVQEQVVDCAVDDCSTGGLEEGESKILTWDLLAGDMFVVGVYLDAAATETLDVALLDGNADTIMESQADSSTNGYGWYYTDTDSVVMLYVTEASGGAVVAYTVDPLVISTPLLESGQSYTSLPVNVMPADTLPNAGVDHFTGTAGQMFIFSDFVPNNPPKNWIDPSEQVYTPTIDLIGSYDVRNGGLDALTPVLAVLPWDGDFLHLVWDSGNDDGIIGATYDVTVNAVTPTDVGAPTADNPATLTGQTIDADTGFGVFAFTGSASGFTNITVTPTAGTTIQPEVWFLNFGELYCFFTCDWYPDPTMYEIALTDSATAGAEGEAASISTIAPYDGPYIIMVSDAGGNAGAGDTFDIEISMEPPPANDTCDGAEFIDVSSGSAQVSGMAVTNAVGDPGCTGYSANGLDAFYYVTLSEGQTIEIVESSSSDNSLYLFTDCDDVAGTCVAGADDTFTGDDEVVTYTIPAGAGGDYIISADAYSGGGAFTLTITVTGP